MKNLTNNILVPFGAGGIRFLSNSIKDNEIILTPSSNEIELREGTQLSFISPVTSTGNVTVKILNKIFTLFKSDGSAIGNGDIKYNSPYSVILSNDRFLIIGSIDDKELKNKIIELDKKITDTSNSKLDKTSKSVDSSKLEGFTKAQIVDEARNGLAVSGHNHNDIYHTKQEIDLSTIKRRYSKTIQVNGDANTFYPVSIPLGALPKQKITCWRWYAETAPDTWYTPTHKGGLILDMEVTLGGWGGMDYHVRGFLAQTYSKIIGNVMCIGPATDVLVLMLRGGGAKYTFESEFPITIDIHLGKFDNAHSEGKYPGSVDPISEPVGIFNSVSLNFYFNTLPEYQLGGFSNLGTGNYPQVYLGKDNNGNLSIKGTITQNGHEVWNKGNFNPDAKANADHNHNSTYYTKDEVNKNITNVLNVANAKEPIVSKKTGFNLEKTDVVVDDANKLVSGKAVFDIKNTMEKDINDLRREVNLEARMTKDKVERYYQEIHSELSSHKTTKDKSLLWEGNLGNGNFTLNRPYTAFDELEFWGSDDGNSALQVSTVPQGALTWSKAFGGGMYFNGIGTLYWKAKIQGDNRTFACTGENSVIRKVYGINNK